MSVLCTGPDRIQYLLPADGIVGWFDEKSGAPELPLIRWALETFDLEGKNFVDVGAHCGTWSFRFAGKASAVFAFEAQRATFYRLCGGITLNNLDDAIVARHVAVGDAPGFAELRVTTRDGGGSSIAKGLPTHARPLFVERVPVATLDSFDISDVGLVKIDVEGNERAVLEGAKDTLLRSKLPPVLFECWGHDWFAEEKKALFACLAALGYQVQAVSWPEMFLATRI